MFKRILLILALICMVTVTTFGALSGTYTSNSYFYLPGYGSYGTEEYNAYNAAMEVADNAIKDNETASGNENIQDIAGGMTTGNTETFISVDYQDVDGTIDFVVPVKDEDNMVSDSASHLATQQSIKAYADSLAGSTTEKVQDIAGSMWTGNTETLITLTYQDADGTIDAVVDSNLDDYDNSYSEFINNDTQSLTYYYSKNAINTQGEVETIWGVTLATDTELSTGLGLRYLKTEIDTQAEMETIWGVDLANASDKLSVFAATTSAELAGVVSDETGSGLLVFGTAPTITTINLTGGQIAFPATAAPSADANTLDDYEEGAWTPALKFGEASVDMTYTTLKGHYVKIGGLVLVSGYILLSAKGSSTGNAIIAALPFIVKNVDGCTVPVNLMLNRVTFANFPEGYANQNNSVIYLGEITEAGVVTFLNDADFANDSSIIFSATYAVN